MTILLRQKPLPQVVRQIVQRDNGAWFDPEDMSTMYQDAAGTTPVTALEQPVGLWLDKSGKGNHATQSITASLPTLSARYNLAIYSKTVMTGFNSWSGGAVGTVNSDLAPDGTLTASTVTAQGWMWREGFGGAFGPVNFSIYARAPAGTSFTTNLNIWNVGSGTLKAFKTITVTDEWKRFDVSGITTAGGSLCRIAISDAGGGGKNPAVGSMWWGYQVTNGLSLLPYQSVNTDTDYDSVGWPRYLRGDGIDDFYILPFLNLYGNGACSIVAARDAVSQATDTYIISERSTTDTGPKYFPSRQLANGGNMDSYIVSDEGTVRLDTIGSAFSGVKLAAIRSVVDSGNNIKLFKDGAVVADDNYTSAGTLTLNNTTIGASVSTTTSNYANMRLYGLIITKSALSDTDRRRCEQFLASRLSPLGVTLS